MKRERPFRRTHVLDLGRLVSVINQFKIFSHLLRFSRCPHDAFYFSFSLLFLLCVSSRSFEGGHFGEPASDAVFQVRHWPIVPSSRLFIFCRRASRRRHIRLTSRAVNHRPSCARSPPLFSLSFFLHSPRLLPTLPLPLLRPRLPRRRSHLAGTTSAHLSSSTRSSAH